MYKRQIQEHVPPGRGVRVTRIGFGIPSGGGVLYADSVTLKSALDSRRAVSYTHLDVYKRQP